MVLKYALILTAVAGLLIAGCERYIDSTDPIGPGLEEIAVPTNLSAQMLDGAVILSWQVNDTTGIVRYRVYAANASDTSRYILRDSTAETTITLTNLPVNQRYLLRVAGVRESGHEGERSDPIGASVQHLSISINGGNEYTSSRTVQVRVNALPGAATHAMLSEDLGLQGAMFVPLSASARSYTLSAGDGLKTVYAKVQFDDGLVTAEALVDSIVLDTHAEIDSVYFNEPGNGEYFRLDEVITFGVAAGESGGAASVSFTGAGSVVLKDDGTDGDSVADDGRYHGRWTVPEGFILSGEAVSGTFTDAAGNRRQATSRTVKIYTPPTPVTAAVVATGTGQVALSWTQSSSTIFAWYQVYRSTSPTMDGAALVTTITDRETTSYTDSGLTGGTRYYYRVWVHDSSSLATGSLVVSVVP